MRVEVTVDWGSAPKRKQAEPDTPSIPRSRAERRLYFIALGQHIEDLVSSSHAESLAEIARICSVSRARVSRLFSPLP